LQQDGAARRHDPVGGPGVERVGLDVDPAPVDLQPGLGIVDLQHVELGAAFHADTRAGERELASGVGFGPDRVARRERRVDDGRTPAALLVIVEGNAALDEGQPAGLARRVALSLRDTTEADNSGDQGDDEGDVSGMPHGWVPQWSKSWS